MGEVVFDDAAHRYYLGQRELPSVTKVLSALGLYSSWFATEEHRQRGEAVHHACRLVGLGRYTEDGTHPALIPYVRAWLRFVEATGYRSLGGEEPLGSARFGYAGRPDDWGVVNGDVWLADLKSGGHPAAVPLQLAAYDLLLQESGVAITKRRCVQLENDGNYKIHASRKGTSYDDPKWTAGWMHCLSVFNLRKELGV